jgi:hypothetical protein
VQRTLTNGELRLGGDADQLRPLHIELVPVGGLHFLECGPLLTARSDVLPFILTNGAALGWGETICVLNSTGKADVLGHAEK